MVDFNLDATQGEWFQFFRSHVDPNTGEVVYEDPVDDARVQVRSITPFLEERMKRRKKSIEHVLNPKTKAMERISYYPDPSPEEERRELDDLWDYVITGFENFKDAKTGELIPCTRENKIALMRIPVFDRFIAQCLQIIADSGAKAKEEAEKNL